MACAYSQQGGDHNPYYISIKMGIVTWGTGGMYMAAMSSLHDVLHVTVFQIIGTTTHDEGGHV